VGAVTCTLGKQRDRETQSAHIHSHVQAAAFQERSNQTYKHITGGPLLHTACRCRRHRSCAHSPSAIATPHQTFLRHFVDFAQDDMFMWPPSAFVADPSSSLTRHPKWQVISDHSTSFISIRFFEATAALSLRASHSALRQLSASFALLQAV
jgi:hypothetical protein